MIDDDMETMSMTSTATEAPIEADKYDLQYNMNEEEQILSKIKGLNSSYENNKKLHEKQTLYYISKLFLS